jgi:hypothetical protein
MLFCYIPEHERNDPEWDKSSGGRVVDSNSRADKVATAKKRARRSGPPSSVSSSSKRVAASSSSSLTAGVTSSIATEPLTSQSRSNEGGQVTAGELKVGEWVYTSFNKPANSAWLYKVKKHVGFGNYDLRWAEQQPSRNLESATFVIKKVVETVHCSYISSLATGPHLRGSMIAVRGKPNHYTLQLSN